MGIEILSTPIGINKGALLFMMGDGNSVIGTGTHKLYISAPSNGIITRATLLADQDGAIVVDVWKTTYALFDTGVHPVDGDSITASAPPTITASGDKSVDTTLTGWTTAFTEGDVFEVNVDSVSNFTKATLQLDFIKTP